LSFNDQKQAAKGNFITTANYPDLPTLKPATGNHSHDNAEKNWLTSGVLNKVYRYKKHRRKIYVFLARSQTRQSSAAL
jgi:hypothetical protein